jgi:hypothetical protein
MYYANNIESQQNRSGRVRLNGLNSIVFGNYGLQEKLRTLVVETLAEKKVEKRNESNARVCPIKRKCGHFWQKKC